MLIKLSVILTALQLALGQKEQLDWDLAVVIENSIQLFSDGHVIKTKEQPFRSLKALAYDNVRDQFVVSDTLDKNDTVYTVPVSRDITSPIIKGLPGDIQGLAVDPIDDVLYWTDGHTSAIFYVPLNETDPISKKIELNNTKPRTLAIDLCKRYIYWTQTHDTPAIKRAKLDGSEQETFIGNLMTPEGLTIDYAAQRLYWADSRVGSVAGRIESINLNKTDRRLVLEKNSMQPYGLAVSEDAVYFTDTNNYGLYRFLKGRSPTEPPERLETFQAMPMGIVANNNIIKEEPDCRTLEEAIKSYKEVDNLPIIFPTEEDPEEFTCFHGGKYLDKENRCNCSRGYFGKKCEFSMCTNYCFHGSCSLNNFTSTPSCQCSLGFEGRRCQRDICDDFCLNGGECNVYSSDERPHCKCRQGYFGERCELNIILCDIYCNDQREEFFSRNFETLCNCENSLKSIQPTMNQTAAALLASGDQMSYFDKLNDPIIYLSAMLFLCLFIILVLMVYIRLIQKRRPRIKKRIIVSKNVTPLTYRPQPNTEQCEITIENCCNMNVCETPCFEPRGEDKKKLLTNMEGEDLY